MTAALARARPSAPCQSTALCAEFVPCGAGHGASHCRKALIWVLSILPVLAAPAVALPCGSTVDQCLAICPTAAEVASIDARLNLIFEADPSASNGLVCFAAQGSADLTRAKERVYQALLMFDRLQFDTPLPWTTQTLGGWLYDETQIEGIRFRNDIALSFCCDPPNYINLRADFYAQQTTRWINPQSGVGLDSLVLVIAHEARHNQGLPHTCGSNDQTRAERGAWGVQYYLREWLAYHSDECFFEAPDPWPTYYLEMSAGDSWWLHNTRFCSDLPTGGIDDLPPVPVCVPATAGAGLDFYAVPPCRALDTRTQGGPLVSGVPRSIGIAGLCGISAEAQAVAFNLTVVNASGPGEVVGYPNVGTAPTSSAISFSAGRTRANNGVLGLATNGTGTFQLQASIPGGGTVDVVVDVNGYFLAVPP